MSEWLKEHAWKACVGETLPWVRIPLSPPSIWIETGEVPEWLNGAVSKTVDRASGPWVRIPPSPPSLASLGLAARVGFGRRPLGASRLGASGANPTSDHERQPTADLESGTRTSRAQGLSRAEESRKDVRREEDVSAEQPPPEAHPRLPGADAHPSRPRRALPPSSQGPQAARRLTRGGGGATSGATRRGEASDREPAPELAAAPGEQGLGRAARVRRRGEYLRAYRRGRRRTGELVVLHFVPNDAGAARVGVTVSRKVGNSVVRHRVKRRILEAYRRSSWRGDLPPWDF